MEAKKDIAKLISEKSHTFSKGQKRIAEAIITNYDKAAYMTAAKLGVLCHVSESTVVRFANELGYEGYPEMQHAVRELVRTKLTPNQRIEITDMRIGNNDLLDTVMTTESASSSPWSIPTATPSTKRLTHFWPPKTSIFSVLALPRRLLIF